MSPAAVALAVLLSDAADPAVEFAPFASEVAVEFVDAADAAFDEEPDAVDVAFESLAAMADASAASPDEVALAVDPRTAEVAADPVALTTRDVAVDASSGWPPPDAALDAGPPPIVVAVADDRGIPVPSDGEADEALACWAAPFAP